MWDRAGDRIRLAREWLVKLPGVTELYPQGMDPGAPSADHPLQRVTPAAADAFAALLGCRLPSPAEWLAAYAQYAGERPLSRWNLRDAAWAAQKQHVQKQWEQGRQMDYPDAGIFWPEEIKPEDRKTGEKAVVADENDGILWFAPVDSDKDRTLHHLVGNVAELVREPSGGCYVVGTSALSPPEVKPDHPYPLGDRQAVQGFSDVGFRLAFKAPIDPLGAQLDRLLTGRNLYLPPGD